MSDRVKRIEEAARALLAKLDRWWYEADPDAGESDGVKLGDPHPWGDALRAALSTPAPEGGDEYRRGEAWHMGHGAGYRQGVEDAARVVDCKVDRGWDYAVVAADIRALAPPATEGAMKEET